MIEADITIDSRFAEYFDRVDYVSVVLPHILVHEAGHFLGLDHSNASCSVMIASGLNPTPTALCSDDLAAITALYPRR
jgi:matrixin